MCTIGANLFEDCPVTGCNTVESVDIYLSPEKQATLRSFERPVNYSPLDIVQQPRRLKLSEKQL